jgi:hypothetical protein
MSLIENLPRPSVQPVSDAAEGPSRFRLLKIMGPGVVTGASDDDPSGIATYSQAGAKRARLHQRDSRFREVEKLGETTRRRRRIQSACSPRGNPQAQNLWMHR